MIALVKLAGTIAKEYGEGTIQVPDLNLPPSLEWSVSLTDHGVPTYTIRRPGDDVTMLLLGPHTIGAQTDCYLVVCATKQRRQFMTFLKNRLGDTNALPFLRALQERKPVRLWARAQGFAVVRNDAGEPVNVRTPLTICGREVSDDDEDEREALPALADLEG